MRRVWSKQWFRILPGLVACLVILALLASWHWRIWGLGDYRACQEVRRYPIGADLWFGRIAVGQDVDEVIAKAPPHHVSRFGRFVLLHYYPGSPPPPNSIPFESLSVIARDGQLVSASAGGCTWGRTFFEMSAAEEAEFQRSFERYLEEREKGPN
jgi:hypothetical protein